MNDFDDPLDLLDDDGDGVIEMSILEEEERQSKKGSNNKTGCLYFILLISLWVIFTGFIVSQLV
ncbi:hypothetical protein ACFLZ5_08540 [Thermodesulfobacteriota bacterium]